MIDVEMLGLCKKLGRGWFCCDLQVDIHIILQIQMEELNELKNLVMQNLEKNGYLSNIRAQIRSSVFKTIDSQEGSSKKASPFFTENLKVQKLAESTQGQNSLQLIQELLQFYEMEHSLKIFTSESNMKTEAKRDKIATDNGVKPNNDEPVLYRVFANFLAKSKKPAVAAKKQEKNMEKLSQMPVQMKQDESQGEVEEQIVKNESKKFGESEQFGQSQGYDITVDSLKLQEYDYYEQIE